MGFGELLADEHRRTRPLGPAEPALRDVELPVEFGFGWDEEDSADEHWYPQGISTGAELGSELVLVSWACDGQAAARITVVDAGAGRYRHVDLVEPRGEGLAPVPVHAGGIACHRGVAYVADTIRGLRAFALEGLVADGERVAWVQSAIHRLPIWRILIGRGPRFSFVSQSEGRFLSGEYRRERPARIAEWEAPEGEPGTLTATDAWVTERTHLQGVLRLGDRVLLASSAGTGKGGRLAVFREDTSEPEAVHPWGVGCEDLAHDAARGYVLSLTEHPEAGRVVFGVPVAAL